MAGEIVILAQSIRVSPAAASPVPYPAVTTNPRLNKNPLVTTAFIYVLARDVGVAELSM